MTTVSVLQGIGLREPLTANQEQKINTLIKAFPDQSHVSRVFAYVNADFSDPEDAPAGIMSIYHPDAVVQPDSIPDAMFQYMIVCPIKNKDINDDYFLSKEKELQDNVAQFSDAPPTLTNRTLENDDINTWHTELGGEDSFAGVFKKIHDNHRDTSYYVIAQAGAPLACQQLKDELIAGNAITFGELVKDPRLDYVQLLARRNAERLAYQVARSLGVRIQHVEDACAIKPESHISKPWVAAPPLGHRQTVTAIKPVTFRKKNRVAVYHKLRPTNEGSDVTFVHAGPYDGIVMFKMRSQGKGFALPTNTAKNVDSSKLTPLTEEDARRRARGITWDGKKDSLHLPDLHPDAYHKVDDHFLKSMREIGWLQEGTDNRVYLLPVVVKVFNPELKRPL